VLGLFLLLLILACVNRFALTERLRDLARPLTRRWLSMSVAAEATLGMLVIVVAAFSCFCRTCDALGSARRCSAFEV